MSLFCVWDMGENEWIMLLDADNSVSWCLNPIDTTHLFLWEKIDSMSCEVMTSLWVQTACLSVCLWQSLYNSVGYLSNTQKHRMTIKNLFLDGQVQVFESSGPLINMRSIYNTTYAVNNNVSGRNAQICSWSAHFLHITFSHDIELKQG